MRVLEDFEFSYVAGGIEGGGGDSGGACDGGGESCPGGLDLGGFNETSLGCNIVAGLVAAGVGAKAGAVAGALAGAIAQQACENLTGSSGLGYETPS